jgi:hypothetical protein
MLTIAETDDFSDIWPKYWTAEEFGDFCAWLALRPDVGDVIPRSSGCRKIRWALPGMVNAAAHASFTSIVSRTERFGC